METVHNWIKSIKRKQNQAHLGKDIRPTHEPVSTCRDTSAELLISIVWAESRPRGLYSDLRGCHVSRQPDITRTTLSLKNKPVEWIPSSNGKTFVEMLRRRGMSLSAQNATRQSVQASYFSITADTEKIFFSSGW